MKNKCDGERVNERLLDVKFYSCDRFNCKLTVASIKLSLWNLLQWIIYPTVSLSRSFVKGESSAYYSLHLPISRDLWHSLQWQASSLFHSSSKSSSQAAALEIVFHSEHCAFTAKSCALCGNSHCFNILSARAISFLGTVKRYCAKRYCTKKWSNILSQTFIRSFGATKVHRHMKRLCICSSRRKEETVSLSQALSRGNERHERRNCTRGPANVLFEGITLNEANGGGHHSAGDKLYTPILSGARAIRSCSRWSRGRWQWTITKRDKSSSIQIEKTVNLCMETVDS